jgi:hypothetical protein
MDAILNDLISSKNNMTIRYLYHYLKTPIFELENQIKGK